MINSESLQAFFPHGKAELKSVIYGDEDSEDEEKDKVRILRTAVESGDALTLRLI